MEWKKVITAIAALMLAYSLVGCASNSTSTTTNEDEEVTTTEESKQNKQNGNYDFTCDYMVDFGLYGNSSILIDEKTGVEYIIINSDKGVAITPRLKGDE